MGYAFFCNRCETKFTAVPRAFSGEVQDWFVENTEQGGHFIELKDERIDLCPECAKAVLFDQITEYDPSLSDGSEPKQQAQ